MLAPGLGHQRRDAPRGQGLSRHGDGGVDDPGAAGGALTSFGASLPELPVPPPGPASGALARRLRAVESRNVTWLSEAFPVFWEEARGANVRDADGNVYLDLTAAFGVALPGHAHPRVVEAVERQTRRLVHGMGDVHPPSVRVELMERLVALCPWEDARVVLASTGSEAVEIALKTALLATGRPGIVAFTGGYHGLTLGSLAATDRPLFRKPFRSRLFEGVGRVAWPGGDAVPRPGRTEGGVGSRTGVEAMKPGDRAERSLVSLEGLLRDGLGPDGRWPVGAVILEAVQGRAGVRLPPEGFLERVAELAHRHGALVVADEVFTGMGRCGAPLASSRLGLRPDIVCLGKALGGGIPLSACVAPAAVMNAWPSSEGEAIHTSTFLGHPVACAASLAVLGLLGEGLDRRAEGMGERLSDGLREALEGVEGVREVRGLGAMIGIEMGEGEGVRVAQEALRRGMIVLPAGDRGQVVELTPPVCLTDEQIGFAIGELAAVVRSAARGRSMERGG